MRGLTPFATLSFKTKFPFPKQAVFLRHARTSAALSSSMEAFSISCAALSHASAARSALCPAAAHSSCSQMQCCPLMRFLNHVSPLAAMHDTESRIASAVINLQHKCKCSAQQI